MDKELSFKEYVLNFAIISRIFLLVIQVISNSLLPDHEADAFVSPIDPSLPVSFGDHFINFLLSGFKRWDAQYFIHIAQYGYSHENTLAFFPLYPMIIKFIATILHPVFQLIFNFHSCILLASYLFNFILFIKTAVIFYKLSRIVLKQELMAYKAALLFCINPASIFFSAPYSEVLFTFLTFSALLHFEISKSFLSAIPLSIASGVRSNGLINIGFLIHWKLQDCATYLSRLQNAITDSGSLNIVLVGILTFNYALIPMIVSAIFVALPFISFQVWSYMVYCKEEGSSVSFPPHLELFIRSNFLHSPDLGEAEWCYNYPPVAYSYIQDKYWEVGLLKYYELKQLPNFLLALPVVMIIICHAALYMVDNLQICLRLGIPPVGLKPKSDERSSVWFKDGIDSWRVFVYTIHSLMLCVFCVLFIHVQVTTRLLCSSSPIAYWFAAHLIMDSEEYLSSNNSSPSSSSVSKMKSSPKLQSPFSFLFLTGFPKTFWGQMVLSYFVFYFVLGTVLFSNFLPWT